MDLHFILLSKVDTCGRSLRFEVNHIYLCRLLYSVYIIMVSKGIKLFPNKYELCKGIVKFHVLQRERI